MNMVIKIVATILGVALVLYVWYSYADTIVSLMDFNLGLIKWACKLLPTPYGAMTESALRGALGFDKVMLFAESTWLIGGFLRFVKAAFSR